MGGGSVFGLEPKPTLGTFSPEDPAKPNRAHGKWEERRAVICAWEPPRSDRFPCSQLMDIESGFPPNLLGTGVLGTPAPAKYQPTTCEEVAVLESLS